MLLFISDISVMEGESCGATHISYQLMLAGWPSLPCLTFVYFLLTLSLTYFLLFSVITIFFTLFMILLYYLPLLLSSWSLIRSVLLLPFSLSTVLINLRTCPLIDVSCVGFVILFTVKWPCSCDNLEFIVVLVFVFVALLTVLLLLLATIPFRYSCSAVLVN